MADEDYPEHIKLKAIMGKSQAIGEFIDWLFGEYKIVLASRFELNDTLYQSTISIDKLLAGFFDIDRDVLEKEKRQILETMRGEAS